jgi:hypothetical protein
MENHEDIVTDDLDDTNDQRMLDKIKTQEAEKLRILSAVASNAPTRVIDRVAWILNHFPEARDSDIKCQLIYWKTFQSDLYSGGDIQVNSYPSLQRFNSISRSRALVQNILGLFIASPEIRKYRGKLEEEEKQKALEVRPAHPVYCIYGDESGKTSRYLLTGSIWVLRGYETMQITNKINAKKKEIDFHGELHFKEITKGNIDKYLIILGAIIENSSEISFKALAVERRGLSNIDDTISKLFYHMIINGIKEENTSGRAILPRNLQFRKDAEEESKDNLSMMEIRLNLENAANSIFAGRLYIDHIGTEDSSVSPLMQIADLFTGCISRVLNKEEGKEGPKDIFAKEFLSAFGMTSNNQILDGLSQCISYSKA